MSSSILASSSAAIVGSGWKLAAGQGPPGPSLVVQFEPNGYVWKTNAQMEGMHVAPRGGQDDCKTTQDPRWQQDGEHDAPRHAVIFAPSRCPWENGSPAAQAATHVARLFAHPRECKPFSEPRSPNFVHRAPRCATRGYLRALAPLEKRTSPARAAMPDYLRAPGGDLVNLRRAQAPLALFPLPHSVM